MFIPKKSINFAAEMDERLKHITEALTAGFDASEARELARWVVEELPENADSIEVSRAVDRLLQGEPVQYVFEHALWLGLDLRVTPATLIPRPETAELVSLCEAQNRKPGSLRVLDIGTGSGCIAIALKKDSPMWHVSACDISADALAVARENAERNGVDVRFFRCDILNEQPRGTFDLIVSNPPYVCESEKSAMESRVLDHEPASALFVPDHHPLLFYERIADVAQQVLSTNGWLFFEINERFGEEVATLLRERRFRDVEVLQDMFGKPRFVKGRRADNALFSRAAAYCSQAERCRREVADKLRSWGEEDADEQAQILERLQTEGFLDEQRYARAFANDKLRFQGWGRLKIRAALVQKGVASKAVQVALDELDEDTYNETMQKLVEKKRRELRSEHDQYVLRQKLSRFLYGQGFYPEEFQSFLN